MEEFDHGFNFFNIMTFVFPIFFAVIAGIILFTIIGGLRQWGKNNKQPRLKVGAIIASKRTDVHGGGNEHHAHTTYYITFEVESGDRMELIVNGTEFGYIAEGDRGELMFQGTRFLEFTRKQVVNQ